MLDVDGTLINTAQNEIISENVKDAIRRSQQHVAVAVVSGRSLEKVTFVFDELELTTPSVIGGGTQIVDPISYKILWERPVLETDIDEIFKVFKNLAEPILAVDDTKEFFYSDAVSFIKPMGFYIPEIQREKGEAIITHLEQFPSLALHKAVAYRDGYIALHITHKEATKEHATRKVAELLNIRRDDIIGVGDGYNDFPLFQACGLRIALGNAVDELKRRADYVAPSVTNDGVAHVIERFILPRQSN